MFERKNEPLLSQRLFYNRLAKIILIDLAVLTISLTIGIEGYHYLDGLSYIDSFLNASMILGGMGPVDVLKNNSSKIFAGVYALYSGITFLTIFASILAPLMHRFLHKFHLEDEGEK
jgi:hypothetical protein